MPADNRRPRIAPPERQGGFSLLETALLLVVLSLALMAIVPRVISGAKKDFLTEQKRAVRNARNEILGYVVAHGRLPDEGHFDEAMAHRLDRTAGGIIYHRQGDAPLTVRMPDQGRSLEAAFWVVSLGRNRVPDMVNDYRADAIAMGALDEDRDSADMFDDIIDYATLSHVQRLVSSRHGDDPPPPLTSLGSTFAEITGAMIALVRQFYAANGRYPRSWGDYAFTDVGLDPEEWRSAYDGVYYATGGSRIKVTPAEGYTFLVTGVDGVARELKASYNWSMWYSIPDAKWYYHSIAPANEVDISTLNIARDAA